MSNIDKIKVGNTIYPITDSRVGDLANLNTTEKNTLVGAINEVASGSTGGDGLTDDIKEALLACFEKVAWIDEDGQDYYGALYNALYPPANLVSISAVYTQSGAVYTTASLNDLKANLVVTAHFDDSSSRTVTDYTLSGTLAEGTSTITVSYGGKTTTFTVTVTVFTTAPSIAEYDKCMYSDGTTYAVVGACYTNPYSFTIDIEELKASTHYNSENDYMTYNGDIFKIKYVAPNSQGVSPGGKAKWVVKNSTDTIVANGSISTASLSTLTDPRYTTALLNSGSTLKLVMTLFTADTSNSYAYWDTTSSGVMPIGVSAGDIIFAGENTPYYGLSNISEASS